MRAPSLCNNYGGIYFSFYFLNSKGSFRRKLEFDCPVRCGNFVSGVVSPPEGGHSRFQAGYQLFNANPNLQSIPERWPTNAFSSIGDRAQKDVVWPELIFSYTNRPENLSPKWDYWVPPNFETSCASLGITPPRIHPQAKRIPLQAEWDNALCWHER